MDSIMKFQVPCWMRRRSLLALLVLTLAGGVSPAWAHTADPHVRTVIDEITPPMADVSVRVEAGVATQLVLENRGDGEVVVLGRDGDPFLRIGPDGVWGNRNARDFHATATPTGGLSGSSTTPDAGPDWTHLTTEPVWGWFDHRLHPQPLTTPPDLDPAGDPVPFAQWQVPMRFNDRDATVSGHLEYAIAPGSIIARITSDTAPRPGLSVAVSQGRVPAILLENVTDEDVVVAGVDGAPFLRIGPDGVHANRHSPSFVRDQQHRGLELEGPADVGAAPEWTRLANEPRYAWLEDRARYPLEQPPEEVTTAGRPTVLLEWEIPLQHGQDRTAIRGQTSWMTEKDAFSALGIPVELHEGRDWASLLPWGLFGTGAILLAIGLRRHRRRRQTSPQQAEATW